MKTSAEAYRPTPPAGGYTPAESKHISDYLRVLYKRRWIAIPIFLVVFITGTVNAMRKTPIYQGRAQLLIEKDAPNVATLDQMFKESDGWYDDDFFQTQYRILQSRSLARQTIDALKLWDGPMGEGKTTTSLTGLVRGGVSSAISAVTRPFFGGGKADDTNRPTQKVDGETASQSGRIDQFLGGLSIVPVRNSRIVEIRYVSIDPVFAATAANGVANAYIRQNMEFKFNTSKDASDWLSTRLAEQRKAVEDSEAALQQYRERNGGVTAADSASNIVVARLADLNAALTRAKTERINKEALYNQLKSMEGTPAIDTFPAVLSNEYIQRLKAELTDQQRQQATLAERYGERHAEMIKIRTSIQQTEARLQGEVAKVVQSVEGEYQTALSQERSLQGALDAQKNEALSQNRKGIEYGVLQREADSNRQIYQSLLQKTKETGISGDRRTTNIRIVDPAEVPRGPISPDVQSEALTAFGTGLFLAVCFAFVFEHFDSRIKTPQEMKSQLGVAFLGMVPVISGGKGQGNDPLLSDDVPANFAEALKTIRTNVLFSSAEEGMKSLVVTSAGPGEGKSVVSSNLSLALAQTGLRILLIDADMRRPRVHEIFGRDQTPGLSDVLTGNAKVTDAVRRSQVPGLWLLSAGYIPPNPAELLGSRKFADFMISLDAHFDWVVIDTPPVMVVADSSIVANQVSGVVFVVGSDKTSRHAAKAAIEQLEAANAHIVGSVLNRVDLVNNPYYYSAYYRKEYSRYYVSHGK